MPIFLLFSDIYLSLTIHGLQLFVWSNGVAPLSDVGSAHTHKQLGLCRRASPWENHFVQQFTYCLLHVAVNSHDC